MADNIVAIDLGTSHLTGIVGEKNANGTFSIVACETVETENCIHRGIIYNSDSTAKHVNDLVRKLERHLNGNFIDRIYVGVGGQSLRTIDHVETMDIQEGMTVTEDDIDYLKEKCRKYKPDLLDVLGMAPAVYYRDGQKEEKPVGVWCKRFEARYKLVVGRAMIRNTIKNSIEAIAGIELAGIIVSPLALADAVLSQNDKELGCALVDFGAGVTSVSIYKDGDLQHLCVIPLGGKLITRDITSLQLTEVEAERLKKGKGSVIVRPEDENKFIQVETESRNHEIKLSDLNAVIEGRAKEIVNNVYARICDVIDPKRLGSGIVLAGCAYELSNLPELLKDKCNVIVLPSTIQRGLVQGADEILGNPLYMMAVSLMLKGTETCVSHAVVAITPDENVNPVHVNEENNIEKDKNKNKIRKGKLDKTPKESGKGWKEKINGIFATDLFKET